MPSVKEKTIAVARQGIAEANARFLERFTQGDARGVAAFYAKDAVILPPGQGLVQGPENILTFWQNMMAAGIKTLELETQATDELGPAVCEVGKCRVYGDNHQLVDEGKYLVLWREEGGEWKVYRDMWNSSRT